MANSPVLMVGAGLSAHSLPLDKDFLRQANPLILDDADPPFLRWALSRLYGRPISNKDMFSEATEWNDQRLETTWSEIDANFYSSKFILQDKEIDAIKNKLIELAEEEGKQQRSHSYYHYYAYEDSINRTPYEMLFLFAGWVLRKLILKVYGAKRYGELPRNYQTYYKNLQDKLFNKAVTKSIISFNYDIILDESVEDKKYVGIEDTPDGQIKFVKPHGSINWYQKRNTRISNNTEPVSMEDIGFCNGEFYQHSIIPPIDRKREFSAEQEPGVVSQVYKEDMPFWIKKVLGEADEVTIIGYGFPIGDQHVRVLLREVAKKRHDEMWPFKLVRYIDKTAQNRKYALEHMFFAERFEFINDDWINWAK